jgi:hypothetical protein
MARSTRLRLIAGLATGLAVAAVQVAATEASASAAPGSSAPGSGGPVTLRQGINATAIPGTTVRGATAAATPESVSFTLKANDLPALESRVSHGYYDYRNFLSVPEFAKAYGQAAAASRLSAYLAKYGIKAVTDKDGLNVVATGTAGDFAAERLHGGDRLLSRSSGRLLEPADLRLRGQ